MVQLFLAYGSLALHEVTTRNKKNEKNNNVLSKPGGCDLSVSSPCCALWLLRVTEGFDQILVNVEDLGELRLRSDGSLFPVEIQYDCPKGC